jgi:hypothetical protein
LCARTLWNASQVSYGFDGKQVQAFSLKPDRNNYPDQQAVMTMADARVNRLQAIPGVAHAAYGTNLPASGTDHNDTAPFVTGNGGTLERYKSGGRNDRAGMAFVCPHLLQTLCPQLAESVSSSKTQRQVAA